MNCFIAMAFGRDDIDWVYDRLIRPVLEERQITPVRVDRIEHNDHIDDRIIQEIRSASIAIADLTYSRPSVYYEAGFAERDIPVIYTVRRDHLASQPDDRFGNFRVHFDLLMKNVIDWGDPTDGTFATRLGRRLDDVLLPIRHRVKIMEREQSEREDFAVLSYSARKRAILDCCADVIKMPEINATEFEPLDSLRRRVFLRRSGQVLEYIAVRVLASKDSVPSTNESQISFIQKEPGYDLNFADILETVSELHEHYIACAFLPVSFHHISEMLPGFKKSSKPGILISEQSQDIPSLSYKGLGQVRLGFSGTIFGGRGTKMGACVRNVPAGLSSKRLNWTDKMINGSTSRFVNCPMRAVPRKISFQVIDNIQSLASFKSSLTSGLRTALEVTFTQLADLQPFDGTHLGPMANPIEER